MKTMISAILIITTIMAPVLNLRADPLTDSLDKIKGALADPKTGLRVSNEGLHRDLASFYLDLIASDLAFIAVLTAQFDATIRETQTQSMAKAEALKNQL